MGPKNYNCPCQCAGFFTGLFTASVFLASIGGALAFLGSSVPWASAGVVATSPLVFDAPVRTAAETKAIEKEAARSTTAQATNSAGEVVVLDDWSYTAIVRGRPQPSRRR